MCMRFFYFFPSFSCRVPYFGPRLVQKLISLSICLFQIGALKGYYLLSHHEVRKRSTEPSHEHHRKLNDEPQVISFFYCVLTDYLWNFKINLRP